MDSLESEVPIVRTYTTDSITDIAILLEFFTNR